ncbi:MAG: ABC transporter permease [Phycisphaera sp.]|nr:ABC transporter permease [Phycisphaera sp.]
MTQHPSTQQADLDSPPALRRLGSVLEAFGRLAALLLIFIGFGVYLYSDTGSWSFFGPSNIEGILLQSTVFAMGALGATMVIITAGIDLSAGSTIALSMVSTAMVLRAAPVGSDGHVGALWCVAAVLAGAASGAIVGSINGILITALRLVPFIVTLGSLQMIRGLAKGVAENREINPPDNALYRELMYPIQKLSWSQFNWQVAPVGVWLTLVAALLAAGLLRYTKLGRHIYAIGSNENTARLCGVPVVRTKIIVYALAGMFAGLAGVLEFSKLNLGQPTGAQMYELYIIAACVIGGASLMGGAGSINGTVIGALIIGTLYAGTQQAGWPKWVQEVVIGAIIIVAVALDQLRHRRKT